MSAKNRKGTEVQENEFYPTPPEVVWALLESDLLELPGGRWIEPCAGSGRIVQTVNDFRVRSELEPVSWTMCELNKGFDSYLRPLVRNDNDHILPYGDFVHRPWPYDDPADVLIMNPPFSLTFQFVKAALKRAKWVCCLQRQGWFGGKGRAPWLRDHCPDDLQLPWRPSFRPDKATDSCEYCWFVWPPGAAQGRRVGRIAMLERPAAGQQSLFG